MLHWFTSGNIAPINVKNGKNAFCPFLASVILVSCAFLSLFSSFRDTKYLLTPYPTYEQLSLCFS